MSLGPLSCPPLSPPLQASAKSSGTARLGRLIIHRAEPEMGPLSKSTTVSKVISKKCRRLLPRLERLACQGLKLWVSCVWWVSCKCCWVRC